MVSSVNPLVQSPTEAKKQKKKQEKKKETTNKK